MSIRFVRLALLLAALSLTLNRAPASAQSPTCSVDPASANALIALSRDPFTSVDDLYTRMQCLEAALRRRNDRRAVFISDYVRTTQEIRSYLQQGAFLDPAWSARYTVLFADQYRRAFYDWERGAKWLVPSPWRIAFATSARGDALIVQELLLGVNAHVNYDLANTLCEVGLGGDRNAKYLDHTLINDILESIVDDQMSLLAEMYAPGLAQFPEPIENLAEDVFFFSLRTGRGHAWDRGVMLVDAGSAWQRAIIRQWNATEAEGIAALVLTPSLSPSLMTLLRQLEQGF